MAKRTTVELIDDLDGSPADETVSFEFDGVGYELDLSEGNAKTLRDSLSDVIKAARKVSAKAGARRGARSATPQTDLDEAKIIRNWARENGIDVANKGRVGDLVRLAYAKQDPTLARTRSATD